MSLDLPIKVFSSSQPKLHVVQIQMLFLFLVYGNNIHLLGSNERKYYIFDEKRE